MQADVVVPTGQTATMHFSVTAPGGGLIISEFAPVVTGLNQEHFVLFPSSIPDGSTIHAEIVSSGGGVVHGDEVAIN